MLTLREEGTDGILCTQYRYIYTTNKWLLYWGPAFDSIMFVYSGYFLWIICRYVFKESKYESIILVNLTFKL